MAFRGVEQIKVGINPPGMVFGGYIHSFSCNMGFADSPTTITLSVINEDGNYSIIEPISLLDYGSLTAIDPVSIIIEATPKNLNFRSMYLVSYQISESAGSKLLSLTYKDGSILLDKIQFGLLNRDIRVVEAGVGGGKTVFVNGNVAVKRSIDELMASNVTFGPQDVLLPLKCGPCDPLIDAKVEIEFIKKTYDAHKGYFFQVHPRMGGVIAMGTEEFTQTDCDLRDVSYSFKEFADVLNLIGLFGSRTSPMIPTKGGDPTVFQGITDRGRLDLRKNFTGSLREVINSWCTEFGYAWFWNPFSDMIQGIDLTQADFSKINDLRELKQRIRTSTAAISVTSKGTTVDPDGIQAIIQSLNEKYSIEGTQIQENTSSFIKPGRAKSYNQTRYYRRAFRNLQLSEIIPCKYFGPRNEDELLISAALSKYNREARTLYNWRILRDCDDFSPLGIKLYKKFSDDEKRKFINYNYSVTDAHDLDEKYGPDCDLWLGTYSEELENKWIEWESKVADFIGRYYLVTKDYQDQFICWPPSEDSKAPTHLFEYQLNTTSTPSSEEYNEKNKHDLPFKDILKHPEGVNIKAFMPIMMFARNPAWGTTSEELDEIFENANREKVLQEFIPTVEYVEGGKESYLFTLLTTLPQFAGSIGKDLNKITKAENRPVLIFAPTAQKIDSIFNVGALTRDCVNDKEKDPDKPDDENKECGLVCDQDILESLCEKGEVVDKDGKVIKTNRCPQETRVQPKWHGLSSLQARCFPVKTNKNAIRHVVKKIIFPCETNYMGYLTVDLKFRKMVQAVTELFGQGIHSASHTMAYTMNKTDITSDLDELDEPGFGKNYIVLPKTPYEQSVGASIDMNTGKLLGVGKSSTKSKIMTAQAMHNVMTANLAGGANSILLPQSSISVSMAGFDLSAFRVIRPGGVIIDYADPEFGFLSSIDITIGDQGTELSFEFQTRPMVLPSVDVRMDKISSRMRMNTFGRTF